MPLLADFALTPDVFDESCHGSGEVCSLHLQVLKDVLLSEGLVRDLRNGAWLATFSDAARPWHRRGKELLRKLQSQGRLIQYAPVATNDPTEDLQWCDEAIRLHSREPMLGGIIVTDGVKAAYTGEPLVAAVNSLSSAQWWAARGPSVRLRRTMGAYVDALAPILKCANSIQFIDAHLDPTRSGYSAFVGFFQHMTGRHPAPIVEVHRCCYDGSGPRRTFPTLQDLERRFRNQWTNAVQAARIGVDVFVWDDFHDRFIISNLVGVSASNGFDTTTNPGRTATWGRLSRDHRDDVQREFDPASNCHVLRHRFRIQ